MKSLKLSFPSAMLIFWTQVSLANTIGHKSGEAAANALREMQQEKAMWSWILIALGVVFTYVCLKLIFTDFLKFYETKLLKFLGISRGHSHDKHSYDEEDGKKVTADSEISSEANRKSRVLVRTEPSIMKIEQSIKPRRRGTREELIASWNDNTTEFYSYLYHKPWIVHEVLTSLRVASRQVDFTVWMIARFDKQAKEVINALITLPPATESTNSWDLENSKVHFDFMLAQLRLAERKELRTWSSIVEKSDLSLLLTQSSEKLFMNFAKLDSLDCFLVFARCCPIQRLQGISKQLKSVRKMNELIKTAPEMKTAQSKISSLAKLLQGPKHKQAPIK